MRVRVLDETERFDFEQNIFVSAFCECFGFGAGIFLRSGFRFVCSHIIFSTSIPKSRDYNFRTQHLQIADIYRISYLAGLVGPTVLQERISHYRNCLAESYRKSISRLVWRNCKELRKNFFSIFCQKKYRQQR